MKICFINSMYSSNTKTIYWRMVERLKFLDKISIIPRSNMHGRKRPFTEKNGDIRRSYTNTAHGHRIQCETVRDGFRIRRSCKNTEWLKTELHCSVYGAIRLPYTVVYHRVRPYMVVYGYSMYHFSDSHWKCMNI